MSKILSLLIDTYQIFFSVGVAAVLSPGGACRHQLSCSEYTKQMIQKEGSLKGLMLGAKRIISCR